MTLQIAMIGSDGWILASDTRATYQGDDRYIRDTSEERKIEWLDEFGLAYAWAGAPCAQAAARDLRAALKGKKIDPGLSELQDPICGLCNGAWKKEHRRQPFSQQIGQLIVVAPDSPTSFLRVEIDKESSVHQVFTKAVTGDGSSPAKFFVERYYDRRSSVEKLKLLSAHTVLMARHFNSMIDGLQMLVCRDGVVSWLSDSELVELRLRS